MAIKSGRYGGIAVEIQAVHKVRRTDRLEMLSAYYRVPVCMIMRANALSSPQDFLLCKEINIPKKCYCNRCGDELPASAQYEAYVMKDEDTLYGIARRYGLTMNIILRTNDIKDPLDIHPGSSIRIPLLSGELYCARPGETIQTIAKAYGISEQSIREKNRLGSGEEAFPGMQLLLG